MISLDVADLVVIAGRTLGIDSDAALGQIDIAAAQAALAQARLAGVIVDRDTAAAAGIGLMQALLQHRPFARRGEQIAVAAGLQFLALNGWRADLGSPAAAAAVIEALAHGQLSPASAAAWLSPRLAAPLHTAERKPPSVEYTKVLLCVQAAFWAQGAVIGLIVYVAAVANGKGGLAAAPVTLAGSAIAAGLALAKMRLGRRVDRDRSKRTWWTIIATEIAMTAFGGLWLAIPAYGFIAAGFAGSALSLAAVLSMIGPRARRYFTRPAAPGTPDPQSLPAPSSFWQLTPPARRLAVI